MVASQRHPIPFWRTLGLLNCDYRMVLLIKNPARDGAVPAGPLSLCGWITEPSERLHYDILTAANPDRFESAILDERIRFGARPRCVLALKRRYRLNRLLGLFGHLTSLNV